MMFTALRAGGFVLEPVDIFLLIRLGVWGGTQPPLLLGPVFTLLII